MTPFHRFADIFALWKSIAAAGRDLGVKDGTMRKYAAQNRFPPEKFDLLVEKAAARPGGEAVTHALVCRIAAGSPTIVVGAESRDTECFT